MQRVYGRQRYIAFFLANAVSEVLFGASRIPYTFRRLKPVAGAVDFVVIAYLIKDKELGFGAEVTGVGQARESKIALCAIDTERGSSP